MDYLFGIELALAESSLLGGLVHVVKIIQAHGQRKNVESAIEDAMSEERTQLVFLSQATHAAGSDKLRGSDKERGLADLGHVGNDHARSDTLHNHTTALVLLSKALAKVINIGLAGRVSAQHGSRNASGHATEVDDRSSLSLNHLRKNNASHLVGAHNVDTDNVVVLLSSRFQIVVGERVIHTHVVYQYSNRQGIHLRSDLLVDRIISGGKVHSQNLRLDIEFL